MRIARSMLLLMVGHLLACQAAETPDPGSQEGQEGVSSVTLGPADGLGLPGEDLDRIRVGDPAPDFTLETYRGGTLTLSEFRGKKEVILVFYRGSW